MTNIKKNFYNLITKKREIFQLIWIIKYMRTINNLINLCSEKNLI